MTTNKLHISTIAYILILGILSVLAPKGLFGHEHHLNICNELETHYDEAEHECSLCEVTLQSDQQKQLNRVSASCSFAKDVLYRYFQRAYLQAVNKLFLRGPPSSF